MRKVSARPPQGLPVNRPPVRLALLCAALLGLFVWRMPLWVLLFCFAGIAAVLFRYDAFRRLSQNAVGRSFRFALLWALLPALTEAAFALPSGLSAASTLLLRPETLEGAALLFLRLCLVLAVGTALPALTSPRELGTAVCSLLRPFFGKKAWKIALAFTFMTAYLPLFHEVLRKVRFAAQCRRLPYRGLKYWRFALPRITGLLLHQTWAQAVAAASRRLDAEEMWVKK